MVYADRSRGLGSQWRRSGAVGHNAITNILQTHAPRARAQAAVSGRDQRTPGAVDQLLYRKRRTAQHPARWPGWPGAKLQPWNPTGPEKAGRGGRAVVVRWAGARLGWGSLGGKICLGVVGLPNWGLETLETPGTLPAALLPRIVWAAQGSPKFEGGKLEPRLRELAGGLPGSCSTFALHVEMPVAGCRREPESVMLMLRGRLGQSTAARCRAPFACRSDAWLAHGDGTNRWVDVHSSSKFKPIFQLMVQTGASRTQQTAPVAIRLYQPQVSQPWRQSGTDESRPLESGPLKKPFCQRSAVHCRVHRVPRKHKQSGFARALISVVAAEPGSHDDDGDREG